MDYNDLFIRTVRDRAWFPSDGDAVRAIIAVLEVLGERITIGQANDLAQAIQPDFRPYLRQRSGGQSFGVAEFLKKVSDKEGIGMDAAADHARAVLSALADVAPRDELVDTLEQLPKEMRNMFTWTRKAA